MPPYPYENKVLTYYNADSSVLYGATLTYPKTGTNFPAIIFLTGSGPQDRDETMFDHKPFAVIADYLTRLGYATLRIDDRGVGETTGDFYKTGEKEYIEDTNAAIRYLSRISFLNQKKIGLLGHSLGGKIAPMVAVQNKNFSFIITLAGSSISGKGLLIAQRSTIIKPLLKLDDKNFYHFEVFQDSLLNAIKENTDSVDFVKKYSKFDAEFKTKIPYSISARLNTSNNATVGLFYRRMNSGEQRFSLTNDPAIYLLKTRIPFLAINGDKDIQVDAKQNLNRYERLLTEAGNKNFQIIMLPGLNHLFQKCYTCSYGEYAILEESFSITALKVIGDWLVKNIGR